MCDSKNFDLLKQSRKQILVLFFLSFDLTITNITSQPLEHSQHITSMYNSHTKQHLMKFSSGKTR